MPLVILSINNWLCQKLTKLTNFKHNNLTILTCSKNSWYYYRGLYKRQTFPLIAEQEWVDQPQILKMG